ncbi:MAG: hypothetical protein ACREHG_10155 [Candidatus Saccharimonadales bacterium]
MVEIDNLENLTLRINFEEQDNGIWLLIVRNADEPDDAFTYPIPEMQIKMILNMIGANNA